MNPPNEFEQALREALRHESAPEGFAERVLAQTARKTRSMPVAVLVVPLWRRTSLMAAIAAGLVLAGATPVAVSAFHRHQRALEAKKELIEALRITRAKLIATRNKVEKRRS